MNMKRIAITQAPPGFYISDLQTTFNQQSLVPAHKESAAHITASGAI